MASAADGPLPFGEAYLVGGTVYVVGKRIWKAGKALFREWRKFRDAAEASSTAVSRGVSVIGPRGTYREVGRKIGGNFLDLADDAWTWEKNVQFLDGIIARGDDVIFAGKFNLARLDPNSVLAREIAYLIDHGYSWTDDFSRLVLK
jgi:hypothetical protein